MTAAEFEAKFGMPPSENEALARVLGVEGFRGGGVNLSGIPEAVADPGKGDRDKAYDTLKDAAGSISDLENYIPSYEDLALSQMDINNGRYDIGAQKSVMDKHLYQGPSGERDLGGLGNIDQGTDYYSGVLNNGFDAIAEADYQNRIQQAEQMRRSNTEAALRNAELSGTGGSGAAMLGALTSAQGAASDMYNAGLNANALMQQNRNNAAAGLVNAGSQKQSLNDVWNQWYQGAQADAQNANADRYWEADTDWADRQRAVSDANTDWVRSATGYNKGLAQDSFDNRFNVRTAAGNAAAGLANQLNYNSEERFDPAGFVIEGGTSYLTGKSAGGKK